MSILWKDWCWSGNSNTLATWYKELTHLKRPWCSEGLKTGEGDDRGWDGWMASPIWWTWVWVNSASWWWTGRPGVYGVSKSWTELNDWTELIADWTECKLELQAKKNRGSKRYFKSQTEIYSVCSVQFSHSVVSDSLQPHGLQHLRPPCPSLEFTQTQVHWVSDAIQPLILCHPLL